MLFYAVFIIVIVVSMKSLSFVYCVLFGIQVYHSISAHFAPPKNAVYVFVTEIGTYKPTGFQSPLQCRYRLNPSKAMITAHKKTLWYQYNFMLHYIVL